MPNLFGASFAPTDRTNGTDRPRNRELGDRSLQVLNLRLPRFEGGRPILPLSLLTAPAQVGGVGPTSAILQSLLAQLFGRGQSIGGSLPTAEAPPIQTQAPPVSGRAVGSQRMALPRVGRLPPPRFEFDDRARTPPTRPTPVEHGRTPVVDRTTPPTRSPGPQTRRALMDVRSGVGSLRR